MKDLNKKVKEKFENFFDWIKGAELVELKSCNPEEDQFDQNLIMILGLVMVVKYMV